jgi:hypothetical protein
VNEPPGASPLGDPSREQRDRAGYVEQVAEESSGQFSLQSVEIVVQIGKEALAVVDAHQCVPDARVPDAVVQDGRAEHDAARFNEREDVVEGDRLGGDGPRKASPASNAAYIATHVQNGRSVMLPGGDSVIWAGDVDEIVAHVERFLAEQ